MEMDCFQLFLSDDEEHIGMLSSSDSSSDEDLETIVNVLEVCHHKRRRITVKNFCDEVVPLYSEAEFITHFRINPQLMNNLSQKFSESEIYEQLMNSGNSRTPLISPQKHILTFLWFAGHTASYREVANLFDLCLSSLYDVITRVSQFLSSMSNAIITWPSPQERQITMNYYEANKGFPNIIGSIDGTHIKIDRPTDRPVDYFNRKDYHSVVLQGICNEKSKFIDIFVGYPGSVHDARVFRNCPLWGTLEELCEGGYILGDSAYPLLQFLLTPYRDNGHLTAAQKHFNTKLSSCRVSIEHTFGILKQRFRQLYHLKLRGHARICHFVRACCVLHNIADKDDLSMFQGENNPEDIQPDETEYQGLRDMGQNVRDEICRQLYMRRRP